MRIDIPLNNRKDPELCDLIFVHMKKSNLTKGEAIVDLLRELLERKCEPEYGLIANLANVHKQNL